ncbi:MAG: SMP-30/gluconolactonase/LRE family protein, partial [Chloroflexi bacterium]|nr:SMP-30/gluconolactonase/LRE family protein [Chloroflexota bacterium]
LVCGVKVPHALAADALTYESCTNNTSDEARCKDCCDCIDGDADARKDCRDACAIQDFSQNSDFITVDAPSTLGPDGDYSAATGAGSEQACKEYCDGTSELDCGDRRYCRDACNETYSGEDPPTDPGNGDDPPSSGDGISIVQAVSDEAQMKTIAFNGLAFLTGDLCSDTFFPPGKVSDFFGFQYLRDITPNGFGHNTEFAGRISDSVLSILTDAQVQALVDLANTQAARVDAYGYKRFVLMKAFRRLLENDLPDGTTGLDKSAMMTFAADLYAIDAEISYARADVLGGIVTGLTNAQKTALADLLVAFNTLFQETGEGGTIASQGWPAASPVDLSGLVVSDGRVLVSTYATQLFSWYLGSVAGDTYFCPERHGTYFGSFYMKDIPPLTATEAVTIDTNLTADMGVAFLNALDNTQEALVTGLVDLQRTALNNIVSKREEISEKLRLFMDGTSVDKSEVLALVRQYGEYEGEIVYYYATNFATVGNTLTNAQADTLMGLRLDYYEGFPDYQANSNAYDCTGAWLYASKVAMPEIENTDFLFGVADDSTDSGSVVAEGAEPALVADGLSFAEGPAVDAKGNLYFSDITANRIYKWTSAGGLTVFKENSGGANGLFFDPDGNLPACEGSNGRVVSIDSAGSVTVLADSYNAAPFNEPNDLWVAPDGGVYFTDPVYNATLVQDGEHVYYISPDRSSVTRVIADMVRPNGII